MIKSPPIFRLYGWGQRPMNDCYANVKFYANLIVEYISRRICCQRFYDALGGEVDAMTAGRQY
jgi:hypothetical protein